jgi:hypothetical protein
VKPTPHPTTPPELRRAARTTTTGAECRFPHTTDSVQHLTLVRADLKRRGEPATNAAACRYALAEAAKGLKR